MVGRTSKNWGAEAGHYDGGQLGSGLVEGMEDDFADLAGYGVEDEEEEDGDQDQQQQQHKDAPVLAPDEDEGLQRVHKPAEGGFGAAAGGVGGKVV